MTPYTTLVAEDEVLIRKLLTSALRDLGCEVTVAHNGDEALLALRDRAFDIVISDLRLGGPDGRAVLKAAKKGNPEGKFIMISGNSDNELINESILLGADDFVEKPFDLDHFISLVQRHLAIMRVKNRS
jgi:DNA-binding NtrC family response regulator